MITRNNIIISIRYEYLKPYNCVKLFVVRSEYLVSYKWELFKLRTVTWSDNYLLRITISYSKHIIAWKQMATMKYKLLNRYSNVKPYNCV